MSLQEKRETHFAELKRVPSDRVEVGPSGDVILDNLSAYEQSKVEFVFTNSPSEMVDAGEAIER